MRSFNLSDLSKALKSATMSSLLDSGSIDSLGDDAENYLDS